MKRKNNVLKLQGWLEPHVPCAVCVARVGRKLVIDEVELLPGEEEKLLAWLIVSPARAGKKKRPKQKVR